MQQSLDLQTVQASIAEWLEALTDGLPAGRFRYCLQGDLVPVQGRRGQVATCFAMKIAWQTGVWAHWPADRRRACIAFVRSFQREDGAFVDPWLQRRANPAWREYARCLVGRARWANLRGWRERNIRAETRQSASTLLMVGAQPQFPLPCEIRAADDVHAYFRKLDWRNPWSAGSHVSHQWFMLTVNQRVFGRIVNYERLIEAFFEHLAPLRDLQTGVWFAGNPSEAVKINGAMKILSGWQWLDRPYPDTRHIIDFALRQPCQEDGCGFLNRLFVVWQASKGAPPGYRRADIRQLAWRVLEAALRFRQADGAFSFYQDHAQTRYSGAHVSRGARVSDLHGTTMLTWAIAIALELLDDDAPDGAANWRPQKA